MNALVTNYISMVIAQRTGKFDRYDVHIRAHQTLHNAHTLPTTQTHSAHTVPTQTHSTCTIPMPHQQEAPGQF